MYRADLLALTLDDLTVLSNRGLVKRAQRELASAEFTYQCTETDTGTVTFQWSDGFNCILPVDQVLSDRHCNCTATTICRHLLRSVLAYQNQAPADPQAPHPTDPTNPTDQALNKAPPIAAQQPWNPGEISDRELALHFKTHQLKQLQRQFETNQVIELISGLKPTARLHSSGHTVRFLVPGDLRYTYCDCATPAPCSHVPLAIWAFRQLHPDQSSGIISTETPTETPTELLNDLEQALCELIRTGLKGLSDVLMGRLQRLEQRCRDAILIWPAEILLELMQECDHYRQRDARFSPSHLVELIGELCIRLDAIRSETNAVPQLFVRGTRNDCITELGAARLIGLGCGVQMRQKNVCLTSYFQDTDSGVVIAFSRNFTDLPTVLGEPPKAFWQLAQVKALKQMSMAQIGAGQLLLKSGKRSPDFQLLPGRAQIIINPQTFQWESLRPPLLVENFATLQERLQIRPPSALSPRRPTETLQVFAPRRVSAVQFCAAEQAIKANIEDQAGNEGKLYFPYHHRAQGGVEALLSALTQMPPIFIAGNVYLKSNQVVIVPVSLVFESSGGRNLLQPWIDAGIEWVNQAEKIDLLASTSGHSLHAAIEKYFNYSLEALTEMITIGTENNIPRVIGLFNRLSEMGTQLELTALLTPLVQTISLESKDRPDEIKDADLEQAVLKLMLIFRLSQDYLF